MRRSTPAPSPTPTRCPRARCLVGNASARQTARQTARRIVLRTAPRTAWTRQSEVATAMIHSGRHFLFCLSSNRLVFARLKGGAMAHIGEVAESTIWFPTARNKVLRDSRWHHPWRNGARTTSLLEMYRQATRAAGQIDGCHAFLLIFFGQTGLGPRHSGWMVGGRCGQSECILALRCC